MGRPITISARKIQATTTNKDKNKWLKRYTSAWAPVKKVPFFADSVRTVEI